MSDGKLTALESWEDFKANADKLELLPEPVQYLLKNAFLIGYVYGELKTPMPKEAARVL